MKEGESYKKRILDAILERKLEKAAIKARLKSEMSHDSHFRNIDADWIVD